MNLRVPVKSLFVSAGFVTPRAHTTGARILFPYMPPAWKRVSFVMGVIHTLPFDFNTPEGWRRFPFVREKVLA